MVDPVGVGDDEQGMSILLVVSFRGGKEPAHLWLDLQQFKKVS